jgi:hypothetical protein
MERYYVEEKITREIQSIDNGYKLMTPHLQEAIQQTNQLFPRNIDGVLLANPQEHSVIFHDLGRGRLEPGPQNVGTDSSVQIPPGLADPTARVYVHSHPYTGMHAHTEPSMADQAIARMNPNVHHIVQVPESELDFGNRFLIYSGAVPPRFYTLVPNHDNLPVSPRAQSPDGHEEPSYRPHPFPDAGSP